MDPFYQDALPNTRSGYNFQPLRVVSGNYLPQDAGRRPENNRLSAEQPANAENHACDVPKFFNFTDKANKPSI